MRSQTCPTPAPNHFPRSGPPGGESVSHPRPPYRVCYVIDNLGIGGTERQMLSLLQHVDRAEVQPYLCLLDGTASASRSLEPTHCPVLRLGVRSFKRPGALLAAGKFLRFLRRERIAAVQTYFTDSTHFAVPLARLAGVPLVLTTKNNQFGPESPMKGYLNRLTYGMSHGTVVNCDPCKQTALAQHLSSPTRCHVILNGLDPDLFELPPPFERPDRAPTLGILANLRRVKRIDLLIRATAKLVGTFPGLRLLVAGEGEERAGLEQLATELGVASNVHLLGRVSDVARFLGSVDIALLTSESEGMSNALLEYMATGRAVVATDVGANSRLLTHTEQGLLVPPDDVDALAGAVETLLHDRDRARALGLAARRRAASFCTPTQRAKQFQLLYRQLLEHRSIPHPDGETVRLAPLQRSA